MAVENTHYERYKFPPEVDDWKEHQSRNAEGVSKMGSAAPQATALRFIVSRGVVRRDHASMRRLQFWPKCVSSTPFGRPVDPEVYGCTASEAGAGATAVNVPGSTKSD